MKFNVLTESWIPVRDVPGDIREMGILDVLEHASEFVEITDSMPHYEFGIYRMLFVFLMDAYRPETEYDIEDLLAEKRFDMELIREYVSKCNADGERFDLLDEDFPFMQCGRNQWIDDVKLKSPANLSPVFAAGNNHVHFDHCLEKDKKLSVKEAAKAICAVNLFCTSGAQGYPSTPSGAPPVYTIVKGANLFETLVYGMVPVIGNHHKDLPLWRTTALIESKKEIAVVSLLEGLTFPCRRIRILAGETDMISDVLFEQGMNYVNYEAWKDPYVTYYRAKNGRANLKPNIDKETWRDLGTLADNQECAPEVVKQYLRLKDESASDRCTVCTYSVVTNQAAYLDVQKGEYILPEKVIRTPMRFESMKAAIDATENYGKTLYRAVSDLEKAMKFDGKTGASAAEKERTIQRYFSESKSLFFNWLFSSLRDLPAEQLGECRTQWEAKMKKLCWAEYDHFVQRLGSDIRMMMAAEKVIEQYKRKGE